MSPWSPPAPLDALVHVVVEDGDHLPVDLDRVRDPDGLLAEELGHLLGDRRLAAARRAVEEDRAAGRDGGADLREHRVVEHEIAERLRDVGRMHDDVAHGLALQALDVVGERHRHRPDVLVDGEQLRRARAPGGREVHAVAAVGEPERLHEHVLPHALEDALDDVGPDVHAVGELLHRGLAEVEERLERDRLDHAGPDAELIGRRPFEIRTQHGSTPLTLIASGNHGAFPKEAGRAECPT